MRTIQTSLGPVPIWGTFEQFDAGRPLVLLIRGAFAREDQYAGLALDLPDCDTAFLHLPGMHSPHFSEPSFEAFGAAYDEVTRETFGDRPFVKVGVSMGGLAAMAMRTGAATLALDAPLSTANLWPIRPRLTYEHAKGGEIGDWVWRLFGARAGETVNRDYRDLVRAAPRPLTFMIAGDPLEPERQVETSPGLITAEDRRFLKTIPDMRRLTVEGAGHNLAYFAGAHVVAEIRRTLVRGGFFKPA